jgi:hypothetical protein
MTATESARLHDALHRELGVKPAAAPAVAARPAWGRWAGWAFGAAAVFLGAVLVLPAVLGGGGDDAATETIAGAAFDEEAGSATTSAASELPRASLDAAESAPADEVQAGTLDSAGDGAGDDAAAPTTTAPAAGTPAYLIEDGITEELRQDVIGRLRIDTATFRASDVAARDSSPGLVACLEDTTLALYPEASDTQVIGVVVGSDGVERTLLAFVFDPLEDSVIAALLFPGCEVYATIP